MNLPLPMATVAALTHEGRGIAHVAGKTVFIEGALPGEKVLFRYLRRRSKFDEGCVVKVLQPATSRIQPRCRHFGVCGGCRLQHMSPKTQLELKQASLKEQLYHFGGVEPEQWLPPLAVSPWGYRRKARLGVKFVRKKGRVLVGFREKTGSFIAELTRCEVLHPSVGEIFPELAQLIASLGCYDRIPQVEVAVGDEATALVFRHLIPLAAADSQRLVAFGRERGLHIYLQGGGPETVRLLWPQETQLRYSHFGDLNMRFLPTDFIQVNGRMNSAMVSQALKLLDIKSQERVLDLFCGIGNFTLPIGRCGAEVVGVEGDAALVARAKANATANGLINVLFEEANLQAEDWIECAWARQKFAKVLLDPPRSGALVVVQQLSRLNAQRIVYISCNPATLARDAGELVHRQGYRLRCAGVIDMFPQTAHTEAIALFVHPHGL